MLQMAETRAPERDFEAKSKFMDAACATSSSRGNLVLVLRVVSSP